ncbi:hypothetical protein CYMTET_15123 [Cymbomonas tetramitiformis]|uniref:Uncharacterized protein n=1 Tax=Cymbomonas tetramitiformis TaxID=36881 RepID=A0AAE0GG53_9CHLO|nr:hypothetical protein CYMTET_15123 [Cymbomonas tetramitiformis]
MATSTPGYGSQISVWHEDENGQEVAESYTLRDIAYSVDPHGVALVYLNIPGKLNPLRQNLFWELHFIVEHMARDNAVKAVVWTGAGRAFCAGYDFSEDVTAKPKVSQAVQDYYVKHNKGSVKDDIACKYLVLQMWDFPKPSICAVNGIAVGGGANFALNCHDMVYVAKEARFKYPFIQLGIVPELASTLLLPKICGMARAKEMLFLGDWFGAETVERCGLVNKVCVQEELLPCALETARKLAGSNPTALRLSKQLINGRMRDEVEAALDKENEYILQAWGSEEFRKGMQAYKENLKKSEPRPKI